MTAKEALANLGKELLHLALQIPMKNNS
jgi:hypothetical protein